MYEAFFGVFWTIAEYQDCMILFFDFPRCKYVVDG